jgi:hypothetical protein
MRQFVADIVRSGTTTVDALMAMLTETRHAQFLFKGSDDISGFVYQFYEKGIDLKFTRQEHEAIHTPEKESERLQLIEREDKLLAWFTEQNEAINDKFKPYLQLDR